MKLSKILRIEDKNENFIYFKVLCGINDSDRDSALTMNGFDGRETFIRVKMAEGKIEAITCWYTSRTPENVLTFYFTSALSTPDPLAKCMHDSLMEAIEELKLL